MLPFGRIYKGTSFFNRRKCVTNFLCVSLICVIDSHKGEWRTGEKLPRYIYHITPLQHNTMPGSKGPIKTAWEGHVDMSFFHYTLEQDCNVGPFLLMKIFSLAQSDIFILMDTHFLPLPCSRTLSLSFQLKK